MADGDFVSDDELDQYINQGVAELHNILVNTHSDYFMATSTLTTVADTDAYALPDNFLKLLKVRMTSQGSTYNLKQVMVDEMEGVPAYGIDNGLVPYRYRILGNQIYLHPTPSTANDSIVLWYVPQSVPLSHPAAKVSYAVAPGFEEFIVSHAAAMMALKEDTDALKHLQRKAEYKRTIQETAKPRNSGDAQRIVDVRRRPRTFRGW